MRIITFLDEAQRLEFSRLRRRPWQPWEPLVRGEWSQSPYHAGRAAFAWARSRTGGLWGLKEVGFPSRIAAVALEVAKEAPEEVLGNSCWRCGRMAGPTSTWSTASRTGPWTGSC